MSLDMQKAQAFLTSRRGGVRPARSPFVRSVLRRLGVDEDLRAGAVSQRSIVELLNDLSEQAVDLGGWAALVDQHPDRGMNGSLPLSVALRIPVELDEVLSLAALAHQKIAALLEELERASAQSALDEGRGA